VLTVLGRLGVPAWSDVMVVVFSGERLYPTGTTGQLWLAVIAVVAVSCASGMYPAWIALRVSPRRAMTPEE
jgi:ABC-type antimicrobial peptide transport system permease subunit